MAAALLALPAGAQVLDERVERPQKLSAWLAQAGVSDAHFLPGLMWMVEGARAAQAQQRTALIRTLRGKPEVSARLIRVLEAQPVTGRLPVDPSALRNGRFDAQHDPGLLPGDHLVVSVRPETVLVLGARGQWCVVEHASEASVRAYAKVCWDGDGTAPGAGDSVWLIQPDGEVQKVRLSRWGQDEPPAQVMPGAWIWAPPAGDTFSEGINAQMAHWLATQGASGMAPGVEVRRIDGRRPAQADATPAVRSAAAETSGATPSSPRAATSSDWGTTGLLQTPSARMRPSGTVAAQLQHVRPYTMGQFMVQPWEPLEVGVRVARVEALDAAQASSAIKDQSLDLKLRLWNESKWLPTVAAGARDVVGDTRVGAQYLVANKQVGEFDFSLGLGWGHLAGREGAKKRLFQRPARSFAGVQYQPEAAPWSLKVEYDGGADRPDAQGVLLNRRTRWNWGATYRVAEFVELAAGLERGREASLGMTVALPWERLFPQARAVAEP